MINENALIREKQLRELWPMCKATLYNRIRQGIIPAPIKVGRQSFWRYSEIISIIESLGAEK
ncbi:MAG: hypothetical protein Kow0029_13830 [Candidatus Rifleibacteriota bacterium]|jgi:predicted DNA-binding transcriptional regulator AlpA